MDTIKSVPTANIICLLKTPELAKVASRKRTSEVIDLAREKDWVVFDNKADTFLSFTHECLGYQGGTPGKEVSITIEIVDPLSTFETNLMSLSLKTLLGSNKKIAQEYFRLTESLDKTDYNLSDEFRKVSGSLKLADKELKKLQDKVGTTAFEKNQKLRQQYALDSLGSGRLARGTDLLRFWSGALEAEAESVEKRNKEIENRSTIRDTLRERYIQEIAKSAEGYRDKIRRQIEDLKKDVTPEVYFYYGVGDNPDSWAGPVYGTLIGVQYLYNGEGGVRTLRVKYSALDTGSMTAAQEKIMIKGMGRSITAAQSLNGTLHDSVTGVITDYLAKGLQVPKSNVLVLLPDLDTAKKEQIDLNTSTILNTKPHVIVPFQERVMTLGQMGLKVSYIDSIDQLNQADVQGYLDTAFINNVKEFKFGPKEQTGSFEAWAGIGFVNAQQATGDIIQALASKIPFVGPEASGTLFKDATKGALNIAKKFGAIPNDVDTDSIAETTFKSTGADFTNELTNSVQSHLLSTITIDDSMYINFLNPEMGRIVKNSYATFVLNETETFSDGLTKIEAGLKENSDEAMINFDLFYESDLRVLSLIETTIRNTRDPNFAFDPTCSVVIYGESRFLNNWLYAIQYTGNDSYDESVIDKELGKMFNKSTLWLTTPDYRKKMRDIILDVKSEDELFDNLIYSLPDEYAYFDSNGQQVKNPKANLRIPVLKQGVQNSNVLSLDMNLDSTYYAFLQSKITPTLLDQDSPYSLNSGDVVQGIQRQMTGEQYNVENIEKRLRKYIGEANRYSPHQIAKDATDLQGEFGQIPEGFEAEVSESLLFQMLVNSVGDKPIGPSFKINELIKSSVLKRQLDLYDNLNKAPFIASVKTVPFFKLNKMAHVMNYPVYMIINESNIYDQTYKANASKVHSKLFSGMWTIVGFRHVISENDISSTFSLSRTGDSRPAAYTIGKKPEEDVKELGAQ